MPEVRRGVVYRTDGDPDYVCASCAHDQCACDCIVCRMGDDIKRRPQCQCYSCAKLRFHTAR